MKKNSITLLLLLFVLCACKPHNYWKLRIEIPRQIKFNLEAYEELVITGFFIKNKTKDIDLNKELNDYFSSEFAQHFEGNISSKEISLTEEVFSDKKFWKKASSNNQEGALLTGSAQYTEEVRKAILERKKGRFEDPFPNERALAERRFYTLSLDLYFIAPQTGEVLFQNSFKESKGYDNPKQTARFAFFDLIQRIKRKLFRAILDEGKLQERYIISN
jgi:hypothetical protein